MVNRLDQYVRINCLEAQVTAKAGFRFKVMKVDKRLAGSKTQFTL